MQERATKQVTQSWFENQQAEASKAFGELPMVHKPGTTYIDIPEIAPLKEEQARLASTQTGGALILSLRGALERHAPLVEQHLGRLCPPGEEKLQALTISRASDGFVVIVPPRTETKVSLKVDVPAGASFQRNLIIVQQQARAELDMELSSGSEPAFLGQVTEVFVERGSDLTINEVQNLGVNTLHHFVTRARAAQESHVHWNSCTLGGKKIKGKREVVLNGRGAETRNVELVFGHGKQEMTFNYNLIHESGDTQSSLLAKSVLRDNARVFAEGLARIEPPAANSNSLVNEHALLLNRGAKCDAIPSLEIENNNVRCSHSASVTNIDPEKLFYLQSRGLSFEEARQAIALGFLGDALRVFPQRIAERTEALMRQKWEAI
ncbi:SufD family Fe-S cluster assembly protein [Candidatus Micrarchaeota archaeon]|nr:SufD family Fe-S cluster assembly protein [Candidatus Micrarchaeota archaeon]